jgi:energy-coupling factor transporter ATP-binding protein EcfA2
MPQVGLRDFPVENFDDESLGFQQYADALSDFARQCQTPMTIALQGDWGSGKTSLMNLIKGRLEQESDKYVVIWFNTWQYSQFGLQDELALSLISYFMEMLGAPPDEKQTVDRLKSACRWLGGAASATGRSVGQAVGGIGGALLKTAADMVAAQDKEAPTRNDPSRDIALLKEQACSTVNRVLGGDVDKRIVVFIDDLDRLSPVKAVELLEAFKLFLEIPGCVYVLACDYQVVSQGLKMKFGMGTQELKGKSFFDKIIQLPFQMPVAQYDVDKYIESLLRNIDIEFAPGDILDYRELIETSIGFNPRNLKRAFNCLLLLNIVASKNGVFDLNSETIRKSEIQKTIFATICLQRAYEHLYAYLVKNASRLNNDLLAQMQTSQEYMGESELGAVFSTMNSETPGIGSERLAQFMQVFFRSIQLASDNDDSNLSDTEIMNLRNILTFAGVTTTGEDTQKNPAQLVDWGYRYMNRRIAKQLIARLSNPQREVLKTIGADQFTIYQARGATSICVQAWFGGSQAKMPATHCGVVFNELEYGMHLWGCNTNSESFTSLMAHLREDATAQKEGFAVQFRENEGLLLATGGFAHDMDEASRVILLDEIVTSAIQRLGAWLS